MSKNEIMGPGSNYYKEMSPEKYRGTIATPARNPEYFRRFHQPMIEAAKKDFGSPIHILDIACGPADELEFVKNDPEIKIIATDISPAILTYVRQNLGIDAHIFAADSNSSALKANIAEVGILVNSMIYVPDKMLETMYHALKPGGHCAVNFRIFYNKQNEVFFNYALKFGGKILDRKLTVQSNDATMTFKVKILDNAQRVYDDGSPNMPIRQHGQQMYFESINDVKELIKMVGFEQVKHSTFDFTSPARYNNQVEVFILRKPLDK